jgi:hypothetical protein
MSTLVYGALTRKREEAKPGTSLASKAATATNGASPPGLNTYIDALAALVPAEVLGAHAVLLPYFTTEITTDTNEIATKLSDNAAAVLPWVFLALIALSIILYWFGHTGQRRDNWDWLRMLIPPAAFIGWAMLQPLSMFDAVAPAWEQGIRIAVAVIGGLMLGLLAASLAKRADEQKP